MWRVSTISHSSWGKKRGKRPEPFRRNTLKVKLMATTQAFKPFILQLSALQEECTSELATRPLGHWHCDLWAFCNWRHPSFNLILVSHSHCTSPCLFLPSLFSPDYTNPWPSCLSSGGWRALSAAEQGLRKQPQHPAWPSNWTVVQAAFILVG